MPFTGFVRGALVLLASCMLCSVEGQEKYEPTRESLSRHQVPEVIVYWFQRPM